MDGEPLLTAGPTLETQTFLHTITGISLISAATTALVLLVGGILKTKKLLASFARAHTRPQHIKKNPDLFRAKPGLLM